MLLTLNDDCLRTLCKYLKLIDHISLLNTCERLRTVVQWYYKTHNKVTFDGGNRRLESEEPRGILKDFGTHIEPYIEEISLKEIEGEFICSSYLRYLPSLDKIKHLTVFNNPFDCENCKEHINYFEKICTQLKTFKLLDERLFEDFKAYDFSNLTNLTIRGRCRFTLDVNAKTFPKLENLSLDNCEINFENLKDFKNLKALKIFTWELTSTDLTLIFSLPTLKKLDISSVIKLESIDGIASCENLNELVIHYNNYVELEDLQLDELLKLKNFQKIKFSGMDIPRIPVHPNLVYHAIELNTIPIIKGQTLQLYTKFKDVYSLKLSISNLNSVANFRTCLNCLIEILKLCKNLHILEFSGSMERAAILLEEAINKVYQCNFFEERQGKPLMIYCNVSNIEYQKEGVKNIMKLSLPNFIQILWRSRLHYDDESTLECNWVVKNY